MPVSLRVGSLFPSTARHLFSEDAVHLGFEDSRWPYFQCSPSSCPKHGVLVPKTHDTSPTVYLVLSMYPFCPIAQVPSPRNVLRRLRAGSGGPRTESARGTSRRLENSALAARRRGHVSRLPSFLLEYAALARSTARPVLAFKLSCHIWKPGCGA